MGHFKDFKGFSGGDFMNFIFPKNYSFRPKLLGLLDYTTAIFLVIWGAFLFCILNLIFTQTSIKIFLFITLFFPFFLFCFLGFNHENVLYVLFYIFKFIKSQKIYLYL